MKDSTKKKIKEFIIIMIMCGVVSVLVHVTSGCTTLGSHRKNVRQLDTRVLDGRILVEPETGRTLFVEDIVNSEAYWLHEVLENRQGVVYHRD